MINKKKHILEEREFSDISNTFVFVESKRVEFIEVTLFTVQPYNK